MGLKEWLGSSQKPGESSDAYIRRIRGDDKPTRDKNGNIIYTNSTGTTAPPTGTTKSPATKPGSTGMADIARNSGLPSGKRASALVGGQGFGVGATPDEATKVTAIERVEDTKPQPQPEKPKPQTKGDVVTASYNTRHAKPVFSREEVADYEGAQAEYADKVRGLASPQQKSVDYTKGVVNHEKDIDASYEKMKQEAYTDPEAYKKDFMKDNYKTNQKISDILSGARQFLTGKESGQLHADRANAALTDKLNTIRDKNIETQQQLGLEQQKSLLGEKTRYGDALAQAGIKTEESQNAADYANDSFDYNKIRDLLTGERDAKVKQSEANVGATNKVVQQNNQLATSEYLAQFNSNQALENEIKRMAAMQEINQAKSDRYMNILENQGREALTAAIAADKGEAYKAGFFTSAGMSFADGLDKLFGR